MFKECIEINQNTEDFPVDNLIKELNYFIKSCDKREEINKAKTQIKLDKNVSIKENDLPSEQDHSVLSSGNKRKKSGTPIKRPKREEELGEKNEDENCSLVDNRKIDLSLNDTHEDIFETPRLTIDENRKKRKKPNVMSLADIPEDVKDLIVKSGIDDKLENVAMREKLTGTHVKNIIKQVVMDKSVLLMLKSGICGTDIDDPEFLADYEPKLTRARKKELFARQMMEGGESGLPGNSSVSGFLSSYCESLPSVSSSFPEARTLGTAEFPEEEDDDEYQPELEDSMMSDEESVNSSFSSPSTLSIQSRRSRLSCASTPTLTGHLVGLPSVAAMRGDSSIPRLNLAEKFLRVSLDESLIYSRTRSKCPLTDTPVEHLELAFQPPDITADMYETEVPDEEWRKFLVDLAGPQDVTTVPEDDELVDPEYNLIGDTEEEAPSRDELREELRGDRAVKISKKEVDELLEEFLESSSGSDDEVDYCERNTINMAIFTNSETDTKKEDVRVRRSVPELATRHLEILQCQLVQHVQLLTQSILMSCYEEKLNYMEVGCKSMLKDIQHIDIENFVSSECLENFNLGAALDTISQFDSRREDFIEQRKRKINKRLENCGSRNYDRNYVSFFPPIIQRILALSCALPYTELLPRGMFTPCDARARKGFFISEYHLLAEGFKDAVDDISVFKSESRKKNAKYFDSTLTEICNSVAENTCVFTSGNFLSAHFGRLLKQNLFQGLHNDNPLIKFTKTGVSNFPQSNPPDEGMRKLRPLKDADPQTLPAHFQRMIERLKKSEKLTVLPCASDHTSAARNIIVIQNQCETKIILPSISSATKSTQQGIEPNAGRCPFGHVD